jgi:hypothetical protein
MADVLAIVLAVVLVWIVAMLLAGALLVHHLGRANRVAATVRSPAPLRWRWSGGSSARLHRRLQAAAWPIDPARTHPDLPSAVGTDALRADLVAAAVRTDEHLAAVRRAPGRVRRATVRDTADRVRTIEVLAARLQARPVEPTWRDRVGLPTRALVRTTSPDLDLIAERVWCLELGRAEVAGVEKRAVGPVPVSPPVPSTT